MVLKENCESLWQGAEYLWSQGRYHADHNEAYPCSMDNQSLWPLEKRCWVAQEKFQESAITLAIKEEIEPIDPVKDLD